MKTFLVSVVAVAFTALAAAVLTRLAPLAHVAAGAGVALIVAVFSASRASAPRWFGVRHLAGLFLAAIAIALHWGALFGLADAPAGVAGLAGFDLAAAIGALSDPASLPDAMKALAQKTSLDTGGAVFKGPALATAWMVEAGLIALFGLLGAHAAYWRHRARL